MIKEFNFKEKVKSMTANEIVAAMVEGLRNPVTVIDMGNYGHIYKGVCFGCAATNTICKIADVTTDEIHRGFDSRMSVSFGKNNFDFLDWFEDAIDSLRKGDIRCYNYAAKHFGIAQMREVPNLPYLENDYTEEDLKVYETTNFNIA